jgi:hypothetical protein
MGHIRLRALCFAAGFSSEIGQSIFHKLDYHRPSQASDDFQRSQRKASFYEFSLRFTTALCIDVDFFLPHRRQCYQRTDRACGCDPGNRLFSK